MKPWQQQLQSAIHSRQSLDYIVELLRSCKASGVPQRDVYAFLEQLHCDIEDESVDDRILEVADFVAGFCAPHMRIWDGSLNKSEWTRS